MSDITTCRYTETGDQFTLHKWATHERKWARSFPMQGTLAQRPQWLVDVVLIAKLGGYGRAIGHPPPDFIVWFDVTAANELVAFTELGELL